MSDIGPIQLVSPEGVISCAYIEWRPFDTPSRPIVNVGPNSWLKEFPSKYHLNSDEGEKFPDNIAVTAALSPQNTESGDEDINIGWPDTPLIVKLTYPNTENMRS